MGSEGFAPSTLRLERKSLLLAYEPSLKNLTKLILYKSFGKVLVVDNKIRIIYYTPYRLL